MGPQQVNYLLCVFNPLREQPSPLLLAVILDEDECFSLSSAYSNGEKENLNKRNGEPKFCISLRNTASVSRELKMSASVLLCVAEHTLNFKIRR